MLKDLLRYDKRFLIGFSLISILILFSLLSFFNPYEVGFGSYTRNQPPSLKTFFGTNIYGQDIFWRAATALKNTLVISLVGMAVSRVIALFMGLSAGYLGGMYDRIVSTIIDSFVILPFLPILILFASLFRDYLNLYLLGVTLGFFAWAWGARFYRSEILSLKEREFTNVAKYSGMSTFKIIKDEHWPFLIPLFLSTCINTLIFFIGMEVTLSVLGLLNLAKPTIGIMINLAVKNGALLLGLWHWILTPVIIVIFLVIGFYLISTSISDYLDPRVRMKRIQLGEEE